MLASFLLSVREGLEAALVIGIVLAALRKLDRSRFAPAVWRGVLAALVTSLATGLLLTWLGMEFTGRAEQLFEGIAMLAAAVLLTWMIVWMRRQSASLSSSLESDVRQAVGNTSSQPALFWLSFLAVGREGLELVLFLTAVRMTTDGVQTLIGALAGLAAAVALGWLLFASSRRLNLRQFFNVTNILLILFAAGLLAHSVHELNEAGVIPVVVEHIWDLNPILNEKQPFGQMLTALFGYNANPSLTEMLAYLGYYLGLGLLWKRLVGTPASKIDRKGDAENTPVRNR
jgi:high-affinity iron transporter